MASRPDATFGLGIELPDSAAVTKQGGLNVNVDTGHTFEYIKITDQMTDMLSFGPAADPAMRPGKDNKSEFQAGLLPGNAHWPLSGNANTWEFAVSAEQVVLARAAFEQVKTNVPNYTPTMQCTSVALMVAGQAHVSLPSGVGQVVVRVWGITLFSGEIANPYHVNEQMSQQFGPPRVVPTASFPRP